MPSGPFSPTRRELLLGLAGSTLAFSKVRNSMYQPHIAAHTAVWVEEAAIRRVPLAGILEEAFTSTERAGYSRVELVSDLLSPEVRTQTLGYLKKRDLEPSILYTRGPLYDTSSAEDSRRQVKDWAWVMMGRGTEWVNFHLAEKPGNDPKTEQELDTEAYQLNRMGEDVQRAGLGLMIHQNQGMMRDNAREWRYLVSHTETTLVCLCLDVDSVYLAGINPLALIDTAGARLRSLHLRNTRNRVDQELLRDGDVDLVKVARLLHQMYYDGFLVVELQHTANTPRQYALGTDLALSRWYMQEVFGSFPGSPPVDLGPHVRKHA